MKRCDRWYARLTTVRCRLHRGHDGEHVAYYRGSRQVWP